MKKLMQACRDSKNPFDANGDANFWLARRRERLSTGVWFGLAGG
jgi:hypothetical protein